MGTLFVLVKLRRKYTVTFQLNYKYIKIKPY